jgi:phage shock protein PspC (stress-responsive transcriptional regulator)
MADGLTINKYQMKKRKALFRIFFFGVIEYIIILVYVITSALSRNLDWTVQELTSSSVGVFVQILTLLAALVGIYIFIQVMVYVALSLTKPSDSD